MTNSEKQKLLYLLQHKKEKKIHMLKENCHQELTLHQVIVKVTDIGLVF